MPGGAGHSSPGRFSLTARGPFSFAASVRFLEGFPPAADPTTAEGGLRLAFCVEGSWEPAGVEIAGAEGGDGVEVRWTGGAHAPRLREQVARMLSLDVDGSGFASLGDADPVVGRLQRHFAGLRPVGFWSPYEAGAWALLSHRVRMAQALALKSALAERLGEEVEIDGERLRAFPGPRALATLDSFPGVPAVKLERLRALGAAAAEGALDGARLRGVEVEEALAALETLPGVGPFSAGLILVRGASHPDVFPTAEPRLHAAMRSAYDRREASVEQLAAIADAWRPYRSWVSVLFRAAAGGAAELLVPPAS
ncbi:MAG: DNA-3-methyladenine glycosylase family protein [Solirubrobacteraceae bacterium]